MRRIDGLRFWIGASVVALLATAGWGVLMPDDHAAREAFGVASAAGAPPPATLVATPRSAQPEERNGDAVGTCTAGATAWRLAPFAAARLASADDPAAAAPAPEAVQRARARALAADAIAALHLAFERAQERDPDCHRDALCVVAAYDAARRAAVPGVDALARLAASSRDAQIYASAIYACVLADATVVSAACAALKPEQWAGLDPDNALPWLYVASVASVRGDEATLVDALTHVASSRRVVASQMPLLDALRDARPTSEPVRVVLTERQIAAYGMYLLPDYASAATFCGVDAVAQPDRRRVCSDFADLLVENGTTLRDLLVGTAIGSNVGWSDARLAALKIDTARLLSASAARPPGRGTACR